MKSYKKNGFRIIIMFICVSMIFSMISACGKKADEPVDTGTPVEIEDSTEPIVEETTPEPTPEPTTPVPTEPPTTLEPIDPNLPYYEYLDIEFARFGFTGGDQIIADNEADVLKKFSANGCKKAEIDISGDNVPFTLAYNVEVPREPENFWDINLTANFNKDKSLTAGDIIAGCMYIRDGGGENPSQFYLAIKSPTDNWATEGAMSQNLFELDAGDGWKKIYFYGEIQNDEAKASTAQFQIFLGYPIHNLQIGGVYVMRYPESKENIKAMSNLPWN